MKLIVELETEDEHRAAVKMGWVKKFPRADRLIYDVPPRFELVRDVRKGWSIMDFLHFAWTKGMG